MSAPQFARAAGIGYAAYLGLENMTASPIARTHWKLRVGPFGLTRTAAAVCEFHGVGPDELWPGEMAEIRLTSKAWSFSMSIEDAKRIANVTPEERLELSETARVLATVVGSLSPREAEVVRRRYGLGGRDPESLEQVGEHFEVTKERIRQIEFRAIRKLRKLVGKKQDGGKEVVL